MARLQHKIYWYPKLREWMGHKTSADEKHLVCFASPSGRHDPHIDPQK